jgi:hypothetical protein
MTGTYKQNKKSIYNYVEKNREKWNEYQKKYKQENKYYHKSCDYNFEVKRLMSIKI